MVGVQYWGCFEVEKFADAQVMAWEANFSAPLDTKPYSRMPIGLQNVAEDLDAELGREGGEGCSGSGWSHDEMRNRSGGMIMHGVRLINDRETNCRRR